MTTAKRAEALAVRISEMVKGRPDVHWHGWNNMMPGECFIFTVGTDRHAYWVETQISMPVHRDGSPAGDKPVAVVYCQSLRPADPNDLNFNRIILDDPTDDQVIDAFVTIANRALEIWPEQRRVNARYALEQAKKAVIDAARELSESEAMGALPALTR